MSFIPCGILRSVGPWIDRSHSPYATGWVGVRDNGRSGARRVPKVHIPESEDRHRRYVYRRCPCSTVQIRLTPFVTWMTRLRMCTHRVTLDTVARPFDPAAPGSRAVIPSPRTCTFQCLVGAHTGLVVRVWWPWLSLQPNERCGGVCSARPLVAEFSATGSAGRRVAFGMEVLFSHGVQA